MKTKRTTRNTPADWEPTKTVMESGDVERDARRVLALKHKWQRQHELWRVGHLHGEKHRTDVEYRVMAIWEERQHEFRKAA
jgi:hypothetical protein